MENPFLGSAERSSFYGHFTTTPHRVNFLVHTASLATGGATLRELDERWWFDIPFQ